MRKEQVKQVVDAMVQMGIVDLECCGPEEIAETILNTMDEAKKERLRFILQALSDVIKSDCKEVYENGVIREGTLQDRLDFIDTEWVSVVETLSDEFGIQIEY